MRARSSIIALCLCAFALPLGCSTLLGIDGTWGDQAPGASGAAAGGSPGSGGVSTGGSPGSGGVSTGGSAGSGGVSTGGSAGSGGASTGGSAGSAGQAGAGGSTGGGATGGASGSAGVGGSIVDAGPDAPVIALDKSIVVLSGTGVMVGEQAIATLFAIDSQGAPLTHGGFNVAFNKIGGSSDLSIGAVIDGNDGTYSTSLTGIAAGTPVSISASVDGQPLTTPAPSLRVIALNSQGLTLFVDAANVANDHEPGVASCPGSAKSTWTDLSPSGFSGKLNGFPSAPCSPTTGWNGKGVPADPYRLAFDGVDDAVDFGAVNSLQGHTLMIWIRQTGAGTPGQTGTGGIPAIFPVLAKGAAEQEQIVLDVNFLIGVKPDHTVGSDYEQSNAPVSENNPLVGSVVLNDNVWYLLVETLEPGASSDSRKIYINAKLDIAAAAPDLPSAGNNSRMVLGGATKTDLGAVGRFKGDIALALTWSRALSTDEVLSLCDGWSSRFGLLSCGK